MVSDDGGDAPTPPTVPSGPARPAVHPLGPRWYWARVECPWLGRLYALGLFLVITAGLTLAARLHPDDRLLGTHQQLRLPPCGMLTATGYPCPTCGMTTAFACLLHGQPVQALRAQLAGTVFALGTILAGLAAAGCVITGRYPAINWYRISPNAVGIALGLLILGAWAAKVAVGLAAGTLPGR